MRPRWAVSVSRRDTGVWRSNTDDLDSAKRPGARRGAKPTLPELVGAVLAVLGAEALLLRARPGPLGVGLGGVDRGVGRRRGRLVSTSLVSTSLARSRALLAAVLSAAVVAPVCGFAAEGVRGALTNDTPSSHHYFVVEEVFPTIAPDPNSGQAIGGVGLLFSGDSVDVVCVKDVKDRLWAKLKDGSWVPGQAVQAEVAAEPAPYC